jgi:tetratricopeptide (TPR) repeat protein
LHQTIVDYARQQSQDEEVKQRLVLYTTRYIQAHTQDYKSIESEFDNLRAGLNLAVELEMGDELFRGITGLAGYMLARSLNALADIYLRAALGMVNEPEKRVELLKQLADFSDMSEEYERAEGYAQQGLELARQLEKPAIIGALLATQGKVALHSGEYERAQTCFEESLRIARQLDDSRQIAALQGDLGGPLALFQTDYVRAETLLLEGLELAREEGYEETEVSLLTQLADTAYRKGDYKQAERYGLESLAIVRRLQHQAYIAQTLNSLGTVVWSQGNFAQAEAYFLEGLEIARRIERRENICHILANLGIISTYPFQNKYAQAERYLREAIELALQIKYNNYLPFMYVGLGVTVGVQGDYAQANVLMQQGIELARARNSQWYLIAGLTYWGVLHLKYQQIDAAEAAFEEVLAIDEQKRQDPQLVAECRYGLATIAAMRGDVQRARRLGEESLATFEATKHYMVGEVRQWLQGLAEEDPGVGASGPNKRIAADDNGGE